MNNITIKRTRKKQEIKIKKINYKDEIYILYLIIISVIRKSFIYLNISKQNVIMYLNIDVRYCDWCHTDDCSSSISEFRAGTAVAWRHLTPLAPI